MGSQRTYSNGLNTRNVGTPSLSICPLYTGAGFPYPVILMDCMDSVIVYMRRNAASAQIVTGSIKPKAESFKVSVVSLMKRILLRDSG